MVDATQQAGRSISERALDMRDGRRIYPEDSASAKQPGKMTALVQATLERQQTIEQLLTSIHGRLNDALGLQPAPTHDPNVRTLPAPNEDAIVYTLATAVLQGQESVVEQLRQIDNRLRTLV